MGRIWTESAHSLGRKATLTLEFMYLTINLIFGTWWGTRVKQLGSAGRQKSSPASSLGLALSTCVGVLPLVPDAKPKPSAPHRFGIGIFYVLLYMLLKVAFDSEGWLVQIGNVVQLLYLFLIIVQVGGCCAWHGRRAAMADGPKERGPAAGAGLARPSGVAQPPLLAPCPAPCSSSST